MRLNVGVRRAAAVMMAAAVAVSLPSAVATPAVAAPPAAAPQELVPLMVVLDASGSMEPDGKMDSAKKAVRSLAEQAPEGAALGLAVYGTGTGNTPAEKTKGCKDVKVLHKPGTVAPGGLVTSVNKIEPRGYTPIGESLKTAAAELPDGRPGAIVLVSDGVDTCAPPDPCEVARGIAKDGKEIKVHSVGFNVEEEAKKQLTCIAQSTGGTFSDAPDGEALARVLPRVTRQALRDYEPVGEPIEGGADSASAPVAEPGTYLDRIDEKETKYYGIDVPEGYTAHATATAVYPDEGDGGSGPTERLRAEVNDAGGQERCGRAYRYTRHDLRVASAQRTWTAANEGDACTRPGRFYFQVERDKLSGGVDGPVALELVFMLEPPVEAGGEGAEPSPRVRFEQPDGPPEEVIGGGSFNSAAPLNGSGQYTDTLQPGETVFYMVVLDWGQAMAHQVRFGRGPRTDLGVQTFSFSPGRSQLYRNNTEPYRGPEKTIRPTRALRPVRYLNRESSATSRIDERQAIPGGYYVAVQLMERGDDPGRAVPITLEVSVQGEAEPGPSYIGEFQDGTEQASSGDGDEEPGSLASGSGPPLALVLPIVLLIVVAIGLVLLLLLLRRRSTPAAAGPFPGAPYGPGMPPPGPMPPGPPPPPPYGGPPPGGPPYGGPPPGGPGGPPPGGPGGPPYGGPPPGGPPPPPPPQ